MPGSRTDTPVCPGSGLGPAQNQNHHGHKNLHPDQPCRMHQILGEKKDQDTRNSQVPQRHPLKRPAGRPRARHFPQRQSSYAWSKRFNKRRGLGALNQALAPGDRILLLFELISPRSVHARNPDFPCSAVNFSPACSHLCAFRVLCVKSSSSPHSSTAQSFLRAIRAKSFDGLTAAGFPTASSIHWSLEQSP